MRFNRLTIWRSRFVTFAALLRPRQLQTLTLDLSETRLTDDQAMHLCCKRSSWDNNNKPCLAAMCEWKMLAFLIIPNC